MTTAQFIEAIKHASEANPYHNSSLPYYIELELRIHNTSEMIAQDLKHHQPIQGHSHIHEEPYPHICISPTVDVGSLETGELPFEGHTQFKQNATLWSFNSLLESQYLKESLSQNKTNEVYIIPGEQLPDSGDKHASLWSPTRTYHASWPINLSQSKYQNKMYAFLKLCWSYENDFRS